MGDAVLSLDWGDPLTEEMATHSSILAWKSHGRRSLLLGTYVPHALGQPSELRTETMAVL